MREQCFDKDRLSLRAKRQKRERRLIVLKPSGSVCGVVSYCVVGVRDKEVVRILGLIGADDLCQGWDQ